MKILYKTLRVLLVAVQTAVSVILVASIIKMGILNAKWVALIIAGLTVSLILVALGLFLPKKAKKTIYTICSILSIAVIAGCIFAYQYTNSFNNFLDKISQVLPATDDGEPKEKGIFEEPFIVYISGTDSRESSVDDPNARSDVNIVVVVNPDKGKILLASVPRDTYVQLHGTEGLKDKLTHAGLGVYYNSDMSKLTMQDFLDITIDYTIKVSFDTVVQVVDELGGVEIFSDTAMSLKSSGGRTCNIIYGKQVVDGTCALRFSRERKTYLRGDKHRGENQQEVLTGIINKLSSSKDYLMKIPTILEIAGDSFETSFTRDDITTIIRKQLDEPINWQVESVSVDGEGEYTSTYTYPEMSLYVMIPDEESLESVKNKIKEYLEK